MTDETGPASRSVVVEAQRVGNRHCFRDRREMEMTGALVENDLKRSLHAFAEERGMDLTGLTVEWEVRVEAHGWPMPTELRPDPERAEAAGLDPLEEMERTRLRWREAIAGAENLGRTSIVVEVPAQ